MTERIDDIVGEMEMHGTADIAADIPRHLIREWHGRLSTALALERAEHRRQLDEALAEPTRAELTEHDISWDDECGIDQMFTSRRAKHIKPKEPTK